MANKMLIDATHPEETRVVVLRGSRVEEFDFESASKRQLRGNIYLAKVIRVEPSLQAAFVDYGGNRHGFLAFSEIHPDYYQIPVSDRQALLEEEAREHQEEEVERRPRQSRRRRGERHASAEHRGHDEVVRGPVEADEHADASHPADHETAGSDTPAAAASHAPAGEPSTASQDVRPVQLDASQTPPYDDPTPELIEHANEVRSGTVEEPVEAKQVEAKQVEAKQVEAKQVETPVPEPTAETASAPAGTAAQAAPPVTAVDAAEAPTAAPDAPSATDASVDTGSPEAPAEAEGSDEQTSEDHEAHDHEALDDETNGHEHAPAGRDRHRGRHHHDDDADEHDEEEPVDQLGGDAMEEIPRAPYRPRRQYKIQEVIKRRQVLLVQVVKEERGNKGAALTTYLSLAGRYSVLMPNTARGGGISRKITDAGDRQRLKSIAQELEVPDGMGVILRTAGAARTKPEVKRDFEYLMRMWETVREMTLASTAPKLVYEEGSLIKRAIRDLYNKDVEEIVVAGEDGYREAKDFMRLLMPSHAKNVQPWRDPAPIFTKAGAEAQLDAMFSNHVTLKSGGYLVINQTEALVAIDVNSGRSTREHNIEDTAVRTNLEAADEVARQLRLRDLAGLIVVDFIDMEEGRNNRAVERRIKDALKDDRARIQIGRISHFGLLEMSRQRIRTGVLEGSTEVCQHCAGAGTVRSVASIALHVLRLLEDALISDASRNITVRTRASVALYILNNKRVHLTELEGRFGVAVSFETDEHLTGTVYCGLERGEPATGPVQPIRPVYRDEPEPEVAEAGDEDEAEASGDAPDGETSEENGDSRRRRRRRRGRGRDRESSGIAGDAPQPADDALGFITAVEDVRGSGDDSGEEGTASEAVEADGEQALREEGSREEGKGRRRRSRRGGRRGRPDQANGDERTGDGGEQGDAHHAAHSQTDRQSHGEDTFETTDEAREPEPLAASKHPEEATQLAAPHPDPVDEAPATKDPAVAGIDAVKEPEPAPVSAASAERAAVVEGSKVADDVENTGAGQDSRPKRPEPVSSELDPSRPKKSGWWQRAKATLGG